MVVVWRQPIKTRWRLSRAPGSDSHRPSSEGIRAGRSPAFDRWDWPHVHLAVCGPMLETSGQSFDEVVSRAGSDARPFHAEAGGAVKGQAQSRTRRRHPR